MPPNLARRNPTRKRHQGLACGNLRVEKGVSLDQAVQKGWLLAVDAPSELGLMLNILYPLTRIEFFAAAQMPTFRTESALGVSGRNVSYVAVRGLSDFG